MSFIQKFSEIPILLEQDFVSFEDERNRVRALKKMKLQDYMDNKVAGDLEYVMPDACADDVVLERKKELHLREVNANEYYCSSDTDQSPVRTLDDQGDDDHSEGAESDGAESVICKERRNSYETHVGVRSLPISSTSSQDIDDVELSSPLVSTEEIDKEISEIKAKINALDGIAERDNSNGSDTSPTTNETNEESSDSPVRSLVQIRQSLEEKVKHLREEKTLSDEKIRLAQEEEELRLHEKIKLRQQLLIHRKERLKKVISDLKRKLDSQSQRLQTGYSSLLALQKTIFRSRSFSSKSGPTNRCERDTAEAPF